MPKVDVYAIKVHHPARHDWINKWTYPGHEDWLDFKAYDRITTVSSLSCATTHSHEMAQTIAKEMNSRYHGDPKLTQGFETFTFTPVKLTKMQLLISKLVAIVMT